MQHSFATRFAEILKNKLLVFVASFSSALAYFYFSSGRDGRDGRVGPRGLRGLAGPQGMICAA